MSQKRREQRRQRHAAGEQRIRWSKILLAIVLGGSASLFVLGAMVPSESAVSLGTYAPMAAGWCLLLVAWALAMLLEERPAIRIGWTEVVGSCLVGWHSLAALMSLGHTNGRQAMNAHWLFLSYGIAVFLLRQAVRTAEQAKAILAVLVWLAVTLAALGLQQYFYSMPRQRLEYERDPVRFLQASGIPTEVNSPSRELFENRLRSVEPLATFSLTNSLAGVLAPALIAALGIGIASLWRPGSQRLLIPLAIGAAVIAGCLVLTKSRTAVLAVVGGLALLGLYGRGSKALSSWLDWRILVVVTSATVVIGLAAVVLGGLDVEVLSEAPKSVLYRIEYWQATARIIGDHPLLGCGPGNFQEVYATHKLPQASETVADPHNFLLEIWATAGTPAVLLALALLAAYAFDIAAMMRSGPSSSGEEHESEVAPAKWIVLGGAALGLVLSPAVAAAMGFPLDPLTAWVPSVPVVCVIGFLLLAAMWRPIDWWINQGQLTLAAVVIPQAVLLANLLAAGAVVFPGVVGTVLVLGPLGLVMAGGLREAKPAVKRPESELQISRGIAALLTAAALTLAVVCQYTEFYPVLNGRIALEEALERLDRRRYDEAELNAVQAAKADSLEPEPWRLLADLRLGRWHENRTEQDWKSFVEVSDTYRRLNPRHHVAWYTRGNWFLTAWKKSGRKENLDEALADYQQASNHFPNHALYHAQLAWVLKLAGHDEQARQEADRAVELDQRMPHKEKKLARQHVADPEITKDRQVMYREETAEQTVEKIRSGSAEVKP